VQKNINNINRLAKNNATKYYVWGVKEQIVNGTNLCFSISDEYSQYWLAYAFEPLPYTGKKTEFNQVIRDQG
jgi:hypothetical protein